jgi:hypothetical protein
LAKAKNAVEQQRRNQLRWNARQEGKPSNLVLSYIFFRDARKKRKKPAYFALLLRFFALFGIV